MDDTLLRKAENIIRMGKQGLAVPAELQSTTPDPAVGGQELTSAAQKLKDLRKRDKFNRKVLQNAVAQTTVEAANAKIAAK